MAMTTITVRAETKKRLADYKLGDQTFDDVLNLLMSRVEIEDITADHVREHYRRLQDFQGIPKDEFKRRLAKATSRGG